MNPLGVIHHLIAEVVAGIWPDLAGTPIDINPAPKPEFGSYSSPVALAIAKKLGASPLEIANQISEALPSDELIAEVLVTPPGFVNFKLNSSWLIANLGNPLQPAEAKPRNISIEHTSVNPNKAAHIGHLRNACLGDALARLLRYLGNTVEVQCPCYDRRHSVAADF